MSTFQFYVSKGICVFICCGLGITVYLFENIKTCIVSISSHSRFLYTMSRYFLLITYVLSTSAYDLRGLVPNQSISFPLTVIKQKHQTYKLTKNSLSEKSFNTTATDQTTTKNLTLPRTKPPEQPTKKTTEPPTDPPTG